MAWTAPRTWANEVVDASDFNVELRDNQKALKDPPSLNFEANEGANYTKSTANYEAIDSTAGKFKLTITTTGGDVFIGFIASIVVTAGGSGRITFSIDGTTSGEYVHTQLARFAETTPQLVTAYWLKTSLAAGSHDFYVLWERFAGTLTLYAGAGTANYDTHPQFWVRELT